MLHGACCALAKSMSRNWEHLSYDAIELNTIIQLSRSPLSEGRPRIKERTGRCSGTSTDWTLINRLTSEVLLKHDITGERPGVQPDFPGRRR